MSKLCFPTSVLDQHAVWLGKTGSGKSSAMRHVVEYLLSHNKRVCVIDPKGDWWGLKSSADGKGPGYPVIAFGDFKEPRAQDVPINDQSGKHVAELITSGNRPAIIGFRGWFTSHMVQFWIDFAAGVFNANSGELYLVGDEFHNFAPKGRIQDPQAGKCLHWSNRLLSEGRGLGIVCLIASQRPQKVHNDTLTSCETLCAMRVIHKADRDAVQDWIEGCGDMAQGKEVLNSLAGMKRGEAYVWSPEIGFGPKLVEFPIFATFDSFAPPQLQKKVSQAGWADVDLGAVKEKLARVIEEAKANDPRELKAEIARLKRLGSAVAKNISPAAPAKVETKVKEVPVLKAADRDNFRVAVRRIEVAVKILDERARELKAKLEPLGCKVTTSVGLSVRPLPTPSFRKPVHPAEIERRMAKPTPANGEESSGPIGTGEMKILACVAQFQEVTREQLTVNTGYKRSSRDQYLQRLRSRGLVNDSGDRIRPTEAGIDALGDRYEPLPTGQALQEFWRNRLPAGEWKLLEVLLAKYPESVDREELSEHTEFKRSSRDQYLQRLRSRMLVKDDGRGRVRASERLFE